VNIDGKNVNDDIRMALLREEEAALGLWQEYPSNALVSSRLSPHSPAHAPEASSVAEKAFTELDTYSAPPRSVEPSACEALLGIRLLIKQAS
jgi:hypothetical protein